jgi:hypothetical protein
MAEAEALAKEKGDNYNMKVNKDTCYKLNLVVWQMTDNLRCR